MNQEITNETYKDIFRLESIIKELEIYLENVFPLAEQKFVLFKDVFDKEYPFKDDPKKRGEFEGLIWVMMKDPLILYAIGMNGSVVIELYSVLERFAVREVKKIIKTPKESLTLNKAIDRYNLLQSTKILKESGILDDSDLQFAGEFSKLRNAAAHKNPKKIPKLLKSKDPSWIDVSGAFSKVDCIPLMMKSLTYVYKLYVYGQKKDNSSD